MNRIRPFAVLLFALMFAGCSGSKESGGNAASGEAKFKGETRRETAAGISFLVPADWQTGQPTAMRAAQFAIPADGGGDPGELVLFFFGAGQGGAAEANIDCWIGQFSQPDGKPSTERARTESRTVGAFKATTVRVNGAYAGSAMMPGQPAEAKPNYRMWAAVIEGEGGPWFFKAVGPEKVIERVDAELNAVLASVQPSR